MEVAYIDPFVDSVDCVFSTMLGLHPRRLGVQVGGRAAAGAQLTSLIGITGAMSGMVALRFPPATALRLAERMLGARCAALGPEVVDAIAELVNMVAGSAKARFEHDPPLQLGLPTVVEGAGYKVKYPSTSILLEIPFASEAGEFSMEVTYTPN